MPNHPVKVVIRNRPTDARASSSVVLNGDGRSISVRTSTHTVGGGTKSELLNFQYDGVLSNASQEKTFAEVAAPVCEAVLEGYNGTIMCYGQTGAGKSFTMLGAGPQEYGLRGIAPRALGLLFREVANRPEWDYSFRLSCLEIYNENMYDLLSTMPGATPQELTVSEAKGGPAVKGLLAPVVTSEEEALRLLFEAEANRAVAPHQLNAHSSRSHVLYFFEVSRRSRVGAGGTTTQRLTLVDLAGSERLKKAKGGGDDARSEKQLRLQKEAMAINKSLSFLEQVVAALSNRPRGHVPHRSSRLTSVLKEALGGNCRTTLVANIMLEDDHSEETLSTLRFAARMQSVANVAVANKHEEISAADALRQSQAKVAELKRELAMHDQLANRSAVSYEPMGAQQKLELRRQVQAYLSREVDELDILSLRQVRETFEQFRVLYDEQARALDSATAARDAARAEVETMAPAPAAAMDDDGGMTVQTTDGGGTVEVIDFVGDLSGEGRGFSCGEAPRDSRPTGEVMRPGALPKRGGARAAAAAGGAAGGGAAGATQPAAGGAAASGAAFEAFKQTAGFELATVLRENNKALREAKASVRRLALEVNEQKHTIDELSELAAQKAQQRAAEPSTGEVDVIDEEEFDFLTRLKAAKLRYRGAFEELKGSRGDADHAASLVEATREQLMREFDAWAADEGHAVDLGAAAAALTSPSTAVDGRDQDEQFDAMFEERILSQDPDSLAYMKAAKAFSPTRASPGKGSKTPSSDPASGPRARARPFQ